jgi:hypothetical protein
MPYPRRQRPARRARIEPASLIEPLEVRALLAAAATTVLHSDLKILGYSATSSAVQGYTPAQIRHAYGFDQISGNGAGQTIAIVDAYNDPNIANDLAVFDAQFGIAAPPSFHVVNQSGGTSLPGTDSGWAGEIALDVEWAHAIAPGANILLVEANSASIADLMAAVNMARNVPGVSTVSMSWGGSEFFSWGGAEFSSQTDYDPYFTTPAGHTGVTFLAAAGDSGSRFGVQWPASSPNVVSVGGTSLYLGDSSGTYAGENSWSGTSSGYSQVESEPAYQAGVQATGVRISPDVTYDGDPNTGFAVYDSVPDNGFSGWVQVGGTSAGSPQWAALIAIVNQQRVAAGKGTLDGPTETLPDLYSLYGDPSTAQGYAAYTTYYNDVIDGSGFRRPPWWPGATAGFDVVTGLGSPRVGALVPALVSAAGSGTGSGNGGGNGNEPTQLPPSPIVGAVLNKLPETASEGAKGSLTIRLTNEGADKFAGPLDITVYASTDTSVSGDDAALGVANLKKLTLKPNGSKSVKVKFTYASDLTPGSYFLVASIDATGTETSPNAAVARTAIQVVAPQSAARRSVATSASFSAVPAIASFDSQAPSLTAADVILARADARRDRVFAS